jgi:hypothetical protein
MISYKLWCFECADSACAEPASTGAYQEEFKTNVYSLDWQLQADGRHVKMSITSPSATIRSLDHRCVIFAKLDKFGLYSNSFRV